MNGIESIINAIASNVPLSASEYMGEGAKKYISTMFKNSSVISSVSIGHDGSVHIVNKLKNIRIDIDNIWNGLYNEFMEVYQDKAIAKHKALDALYDFGVFDYESR